MMRAMSAPTAQPHRWRSRGLAASLPFAAAALLELGLRLGGFQHWPLDAPITVWDGTQDAELAREDGLHTFDVDQLWRPRPLAAIPWGADERVTPLGYRGRDPDPSAAPRVAAFGDSSTFGFGVAFADTWCARVEQALRTQAPSAQVLDAGVIGSTIVQGLARHAALTASWKPDAVVIAFGAVNEHFPAPGGEPDHVRAAAWRARTSSAAQRVRALRTHLRVAHLCAWLADELAGGRPAQIERELARLRAPEQDFAHYLEHPDYRRRVSPQEFRGALDEFRARCERDGSALLVLRMPRQHAEELLRPPVTEYDRELADWIGASGTRWVDGRALYAAELAAGAQEADLFVDPYHPSPRGHALLAAALERELRSLLDARSAR